MNTEYSIGNIYKIFFFFEKIDYFYLLASIYLLKIRIN